MQIYIVMGSTGEYEDYTTWVSKCFLDKHLADQFKINCQIYADRCINKYNSKENDFCHKQNKVMDESPDPFFSIDYTGTDYSIIERELITDDFIEQILQTRNR